MVSLETTFLVDLLEGLPEAVEKVAALEASGEPKCTTAPAAAELLVGATRFGGENLERAVDLLESLTLLEFDLEACREAGRRGAALMARGETISTVDLFIAAIAKRHGQRVLTRARAYARVRGLAMETY